MNLITCSEFFSAECRISKPVKHLNQSIPIICAKCDAKPVLSALPIGHRFKQRLATFLGEAVKTFTMPLSGSYLNVTLFSQSTEASRKGFYRNRVVACELALCDFPRLIDGL